MTRKLEEASRLFGVLLVMLAGLDIGFAQTVSQWELRRPTLESQGSSQIAFTLLPINAASEGGVAGAFFLTHL